MAEVREETLPAATDAPTKTDGIDGEELLRLVAEEPEQLAKDLVPDLPPPPAGKPPTKAYEREAVSVRRAQQVAAAVVFLTVKGRRPTEIGRILGIGRQHVHRILANMRRKHKFQDHLIRLQTEILPDSIDVIGDAVRKDRDKDIAIKVAEGLGVFQSYSNNKGFGGGANLQKLELTIVNNAAPSDTPPVVGEVIGVPREDIDDA